MAKKKKRIAPEHQACARCGYTRGAHELANFADGALIGRPVLICPFATWKEPAPADPAVGQRPDNPI